MLVILEGMDNSGKSTLAMKLHEALDFPIIKPPSYNKVYKQGEKAQDACFLWNENILKETKRGNHPCYSYIFDRHQLISTPVYEPVLFKRNTLVMHPWFGRLVYQFAENAPLIVYCRPPAEVILNFGDREQMKGVREEGIALLERYDIVIDQLKRAGFDVIEYDYTKPEATEKLIEAIKGRLSVGTASDASQAGINKRCMTWFMFNYAPTNLRVVPVMQINAESAVETWKRKESFSLQEVL
jgi:hypothetical protein